MSYDRFTVSPSMNANETLILDRGVPSIACINLVTHAEYAAKIVLVLQALDRNGLLPPSDEVGDDDTVLVPGAEQQATRAAGKVAGRSSGSNL